MVMFCKDDIASLEEDVAELRHLLGQANRARVQQELQRVLDVTQAELRRAEESVYAGCKEAGSEAVSDASSSGKCQASSQPNQSRNKILKVDDALKSPIPEGSEEAVFVKPVGTWTEITTFGLDLGKYNEPAITVDLRLKGVETLPEDNVTCDFTESSLDLKAVGLNGSNYRFLRTNLEKDIVVPDCNMRVKKNHIIITLQKVKGEYAYDTWTDLVAKGRRRPTTSNKENPTDGIMSLMKDMYEDGDDNTRKIIGEAMLKSRKGESVKDDLSMPSL